MSNATSTPSVTVSPVLFKKRSISWYSVKEHPNKYNTNNIHEYDPYYQTNDSIIVIDTDWWADLTDYAKSLIESRIKQLNSKINIKPVERPHPISNGKLVTIVYQSYLDSFDYNVWYSPDFFEKTNNVEIIDLNPFKECLRSVAKKRLYHEPYSLDALLPLKELISSVISKKYKSLEIFARLSSTSGKNAVALEPLKTPDDIIRFMIKNKLFYHQEYTQDKPSCLILMPWNNSFDKRYEFRLFVYKRSITGISQQWWQQLFQYSEEELDAIVESINSPEFLKLVSKLPYNTLVIDVQVDPLARKCSLIECNPFGEHCGAGSSLFNWENDLEILYGKKDPEFRYLSILSYA